MGVQGPRKYQEGKAERDQGQDDRTREGVCEQKYVCCFWQGQKGRPDILDVGEGTEPRDRTHLRD
jgi:hypothetical protein